MDVLAMVSLVGRDRVVEMYMVVLIKLLASDFNFSKFEHVVIYDDDNKDTENDIDDEFNEVD